MDRLECSRTIEVEDDVGVSDQHRLAEQDAVVLPQDATAAEVRDDRLNPVIGRPGEGSVLVREVDFCLNTSCARGDIAGGKHMRKTEAREANVLVVEIGHVGIGKIPAVHADVHEHARRASQASGSVEHVLRRASDHANEIRQRHRRNERIVVCDDAVRKSELSCAGIKRYQLVIEFQISQRDELLQIGYESAFRRVAEVRDVMIVRG